MEISSYSAQNLYSLRQALDVAALNKAMNQDAETVANLLKVLETANVSEMERSVNPHIGGNVDIRI